MRIQPKQWYGESYIKDYFYYTKKEAIKLYKKEYPQFTTKELIIN
jgi:hypothetical protein